MVAIRHSGIWEEQSRSHQMSAVRAALLLGVRTFHAAKAERYEWMFYDTF